MKISKKPLNEKDICGQIGSKQLKLTGNFGKFDAYSSSTLPDDDIKDEVKDFLDHLVFASNQPNEVELGKIIGKEIGEEFNLDDSDFVYSKFYEYMLEWMKFLSKEKKAFFISHDNGKEFFDEAKQKIAKLVLISPTSLYRYEIKKFDITFKNIPEELQEFLTSCEKQVFNLVNPQETTFSAIKVHQTLDICHIKGLYKEDDSYIFTNLKYLIILKRFIEAFKSKKSNLIIIECKPEYSPTEKDTQELFKQLSEIIQSYDDKKVVLITQIEDALANRFKNDFFEKYKEVEDKNSNLNDLTSDSQTKLLEKGKVIFQGKQVNLANLVDKDSKNIINSEVLFKLMNDWKIEIGNLLANVGETNNYYIGRTFNRFIKIKENLIKEKSKFFITHNSQVTGLNLQQDKM